MNPFRSLPSPLYAVHKWTLAVGAVLWLVGIIAAKVLVIAAGAMAFIVAGVAAMVGGRSLISGVTIGGWGREWSPQELAEMGPVRRFVHAQLTGGVLVLLGLAALGLAGRWLRNDQLRQRRGQLERARGVATWRPDQKPAAFTFGRHGWFDALAIANDRICYGASGIGIVSAQLHCTGVEQALWVGGSPVRRLQFSADRLLWASETGVGMVKSSSTLTPAGRWRAQAVPRALAGTPRWAAWDEGSAIVVAELHVDGTQRFDVGLAPEGRVILAGLGDRVLFGPTADCPWKALDVGNHQQECLMPAAKRPVAVEVAAGQIALAVENGELFTFSGTVSQRWGQVAAPLALSLVQSKLFVVARDAVYRIRSPGAAPEPIFAHALDECEAVGPFGDLLAWRFGREVMVIRRDAQPLEPFELSGAD